ncbi:hypothetical protein J2S40_003143 [Nocardioides luteus]|uniref:hypothetical protein n=1 Tax=Nocardioides luteus TaxID=1844 RepID=UPI00166D3386|nr:hypothetical protein [Nocardioides luteus]MDR7312085.1 hypothetical protein [Nocardioides luteus]
MLPVYLVVTRSGIELSRPASVAVMVVVGAVGRRVSEFCTGAAFMIIATPMMSLPLLAIPAYVLAPWIASRSARSPRLSAESAECRGSSPTIAFG